MRYPTLQGKRFVALLRRSARDQTQASLKCQLRAIQQFAAEHEMTECGDVVVNGETGSAPAKAARPSFATPDLLVAQLARQAMDQGGGTCDMRD